MLSKIKEYLPLAQWGGSKAKLIDYFLTYCDSEAIYTEIERVSKNYTDDFSNEQVNKLLDAILMAEDEQGVNVLERLCLAGVFDRFKVEEQTPLLYKNRLYPIFSKSDYIFEQVYVESSLDTTGDGYGDLISVFIRRLDPDKYDIRQPVVMVANPYMMGCNEGVYEEDMHPYQNMSDSTQAGYDADLVYVVEKATKERQHAERITSNPISEFPMEAVTDWYGYLNARGYATVFSAGRGTRLSQGLTATGSKAELEWVEAIIQWLDSNQPAYSDLNTEYTLNSSWSTGNVALTGKSYLGTLAIGAATRGIPNLKTIIAESAISNWYDYYRKNGLVIAPYEYQGDDIDLLDRYISEPNCETELARELNEAKLTYMRTNKDRQSAQYNAFWNERNYLKDSHKMTCSLFLIHGINDWNVKLDHCTSLWQATDSLNLRRRMLLHQGEHIYAHDFSKLQFGNMLNEWLVESLVIGQQNEADDILIQDNLNPETWHEVDEWPVADVIGLEDAMGGRIETTPAFKSVSQWRDALILEDNMFSLTWKFNVLDQEKRIVTVPKLHFKYQSNIEETVLSCMLVDLGEAKRLGTSPIETEKSLALGMEFGKIPYLEFAFEEESTPYKILSRSWFNTNTYQHQERKGDWTEVGIEMVPVAHTLPRGHQLAVIIYGNDFDFSATQAHPNQVILIKDESIHLSL